MFKPGSLMTAAALVLPVFLTAAPAGGPPGGGARTGGFYGGGVPGGLYGGGPGGLNGGFPGALYGGGPGGVYGGRGFGYGARGFDGYFTGGPGGYYTGGGNYGYNLGGFSGGMAGYPPGQNPYVVVPYPYPVGGGQGYGGQGYGGPPNGNANGPGGGYPQGRFAPSNSQYIVGPEGSVSYYATPPGNEPPAPPPAGDARPSYPAAPPADSPPLPLDYRRPNPAEPPAPAPPQPPARSNVARVWVRVPTGARLWFDGSETKQTGAVRTFKSPPLEPDQLYLYDLKAEWMEGGKPVEKTRTVGVVAGKTTTVDLSDEP